MGYEYPSKAFPGSVWTISEETSSLGNFYKIILGHFQGSEAVYGYTLTLDLAVERMDYIENEWINISEST